MHGAIFAELRKYADASAGPGAWARWVRCAGLADRIYLPVGEYPDTEVADLFAGAAEVQGRPVAELLAEFGAFLVPGLLSMYGALIDPRWRTLDVLAHTEPMIHRVVRLRDPNARPPQLDIECPGPGQVTVIYRSSRRLCALARGSIVGLADHYGEAVTVREPACMHRGAPACRIDVQRG